MPSTVRTLLLATTNPGKVREIRKILDGVPFELLTLARWPNLQAPQENGITFAENARAKALYYADATGELTVAEDSGLEIDTLDGAPGVHSARFGGANSSYPEKFALIYEALREKSRLDSPARFVCALAVALRPRSEQPRECRIFFEARGVIEGRIAPEPRGEGGFGYDPIFFYPPFGTTLGEIDDRKSGISHRGQAFRALAEYLRRSA